MKRFAMETLVSWKNSQNRKPMIICGARQVGKTWLMKEFGKQEFQKTAYINFDQNTRMKGLFEGDLNIERLILALSAETGISIRAEDTLIIFDEVQEVPRALTSLKYFNENAPEYAVIAAGSLLGVALHQGTSFPVGKVDFLDLYPLNYKEFLLALGKEQFVDILNSDDIPMITTFKEKYIEWLKEYYFIGGMPEVVNDFIQNKDFNRVRDIQNSLLDYYQQDFSKHAPNILVPRLNMIWNSIPMQLAKENKKFIYGQLREGARAKDFELAIQWLIDCGLIHKVERISKPGLPLKAYMDLSAFKIYMVDVGLLSAMGELSAQVIVEGNCIFTEFKGAMTEQYILQQLIAQLGVHAYYFSTERSRGEIDFLVQGKSSVIPIEVKAEENLQAKSLKAFVEKYNPKYAIRTSMSDYREESWLINIPLYNIDRIKRYIEQ